MLPKKINPDKLKYDILYRCLCNQIKSKTKRNKTISPQELNLIFGKCYHVPKELRGYLIAELIEIDFLELVPKGDGDTLRQYCYKVLM